MFSHPQIAPMLSSIFLAVAFAMLFDEPNAAASEAPKNPNDLASKSNVDRLKQMFLASSLDAVDRSYQNRGEPKFKEHKQTKSNGEPKAVLISFRNEATSPKTEDISDEDVSKMKQEHGDDSHNHARQSSLFPGLVPPALGNSFGLGGGNSNPLMNGALLRPPSVFGNMPSLGSLHLPTFPVQQQLQPPRPPKTSVIGNGGGAMALTNDNVVVVNVLSGNY